VEAIESSIRKREGFDQGVMEPEVEAELGASQGSIPMKAVNVQVIVTIATVIIGILGLVLFALRLV
jgi:hypothetical protein